jgi:hypothetical protein
MKYDSHRKMKYDSHRKMKYDIHWIWNPKHWAVHYRQVRFNSGNPYESYRFGPLFIRKFL